MIRKSEVEVDELHAKIADLTKQLEAMQQGELRYLWLRDQAGSTKGVRPVVVLIDEDDRLVGGEVLTAFRNGKELDERIDRFFAPKGKASHQGVEPFDDDLPVAVVIDAGRDGRVLCELQAELPPVGTQIFARRAISQVFGSARAPQVKI